MGTGGKCEYDEDGIRTSEAELDSIAKLEHFNY